MRQIYFDNAATSFPKPESVLNCVRECITEYCANPGRSTHKLALKTAEKVYEAREVIAEFVNCKDPSRVIFTSNATHALNFAIKGLIGENCHVITSDFEHNSVIRPLYKAKEKYGICISRYNSDLPLEDAIEPLINRSTKAIITSLASNVSGKVIDINSISKIAIRHNLISIVDASQYIGHVPIDLEKTPIDIICAPGHKALFGLQGSGILIVNGDISLDTLMEGGSGGNSMKLFMPDYLPDRFEAGTLNAPAIISLGAGVSYLRSLGEDYITEKIFKLTDSLHNALDDVGAIIYGVGNGIASFNMRDIPPSKLCEMLDDAGFALRSGLHCSPEAHAKLGTSKIGCVRASLSILNTDDEIYSFYKALKLI